HRHRQGPLRRGGPRQGVDRRRGRRVRRGSARVDPDPGDPGPGRGRAHERDPARRDPRNLADPRPARQDRTADGHAPAGARRTDPGRRPEDPPVHRLPPALAGRPLRLALPRGLRPRRRALGPGLPEPVGSFGFAFLEAFDLSAGAWEPDFLDRFGNWFLLVSVAAIALVMVVALALFRLSRTTPGAADGAGSER